MRELVASSGGALALALMCNKALFPVRVLITIALTPPAPGSSPAGSSSRPELYMLAEGFGLSGIVSILFTRMVKKHYTYSHLSNNSQRFVSAFFFHVLSSLAETFV